jgi:hypothetical protein
MPVPLKPFYPLHKKSSGENLKILYGAGKNKLITGGIYYAYSSQGKIPIFVVSDNGRRKIYPGKPAAV